MEESSNADADATHREVVDPRVASASPVGGSCDLPTVVELDAPVAKAVRELPERVGRYRVEAELGRGGMGVVYRAHDPELDRTVAIKVVHQRRHASLRARERLLREARTLAQLSHPNVVEVFEVGEHAGQVFIAMEFVAGRSLRAWLFQTSPSPHEIIEAFVQAGRGLAAAHAAGLVHRDFKPDNAIRSEGRDARVRVLDFGLARAADPTTSTEIGSSENMSAISTDEKLTETGVMLGTPAYMAPEQFRGNTDDPRSDQFSFCAALHEALFGTRPIAGKTMLELSANANAGRIEVRSGNAVPRRVVAALRRGLARAPADRFPTMLALLDAIEHGKSRRGPAIVLLGIGSLAAAGIAWTTLDDESCAEPHEVLWSDADRDAVRSAIAATELAYATATWERIDTELEAYATAWTTAHTEACAIDPAQRHHWVECLHGARVAARAAVDALGRTDADTLHHATRIAAGLPDLGACIEAGGNVASEPVDPTQAANLERIGQGLAEVDVLIRLGRWDDADERLASWQPEVESAADDRLVARFHLVQGRLRLAAGRGLDAAQSFVASSFAATEAGDDTLAVEAACLAMAEGALPYQERWRWAGHVDAAQQRIGRDDDVLAATCARARCRLLRDSGQLDDAIRSCERAVAILEASSVDAEATAGALRDLAATATAAGDRERAYALHARALEVTVDAFGDAHPLVADALDELGIAALALARVDEAEELLQRTVRIREGALRAEHPDHARTWALEGGVARARSQHERALELFRKVLLQREQAHGDVHPDVARAHYDVALSLEHLERYEEATRAMQQVAAIEEQLHPLNIARIPTLRELARMAFTFGTGPSAGLDYLERAQLIVAESAIPPDHPLVRDLEHGHGETLLELGRAEEALPHLERFVDDPRPHRVLPHVKFVLARALWELDRDRERATKLVAEAMAAYENEEDDFARQQMREMKAWVETKQPPAGARGFGRREQQ